MNVDWAQARGHGRAWASTSLSLNGAGNVSERGIRHLLRIRLRHGVPAVLNIQAISPTSFGLSEVEGQGNPDAPRNYAVAMAEHGLPISLTPERRYELESD